MVATEIYLIRHAEAEGNLYRRIHGQYDSNITSLGLEQILALSKRFDGVDFDVVYSSDLTRAKTTAQAISVPRGLEIKTDPRLREVSMGVWEDKTWAYIEHNEAQALRAFAKDPGAWVIPGNEGFLAQKERIWQAIEDIAKAHPGQRVACVSHGNVIRILQASILGLASKEFSQVPHCDNTGVSLILANEGKLELALVNDRSHLTDSLSTFARQTWWKNKSQEDTGNADFRPLDLAGYEKEYLAYRREAWTEIHGNLEGFAPEAYLEKAREHVAATKDALVEVMVKNKPIGLLELAPDRGQADGEGAIAFFYLAPEHRGEGYGVQLLGHATSVYRALGRKTLSLRVAETNQAAIGFYERFGFVKRGECPGVHGPLWEMELDIRVRVQNIHGL